MRYQRIKQRTRDTGMPFLPRDTSPMPAAAQGHSKAPSGRNDTSVNIATAFREATRGNGGVVQGLHREAEQLPLEAEQEMSDEDGAKETHLPGPAATEGSTRKRKVRIASGP